MSSSSPLQKNAKAKIGGRSSRSLQPLDSNTITHRKSDVRGEEGGKRASSSIEEIHGLVKTLSERIESKSLLSLQGALNSNFTNRSSKRRRRSTQSSPTRGRSSSSDGDKSLIDDQNSLEPSWETYKSWPEGLLEEERLIGDYFRRLKMIQLEQETRSIFVHDTNDDTQTVYTVSDVRQLESEVRELKVQLQARKQRARELRKEIEGLAEKMDIFDTLNENVNESQNLLSKIQDIELELARLKAVRGIAPSVDKGESGTNVASVGTFTQEEAEDILNQQLVEMESLEMNQSNTLKAIETAKRQLANSMQSLDRLNAERSLAEKHAKEVKIGAEKQRDRKAEMMCRELRARIKLFKGLMGISSIDAPSESSMRILYDVMNKAAQEICEEVAIVIQFDIQGGQMISFTLETPTGRDLTERIAPKGTWIRSQMNDALHANDANLFIQTALMCIESMHSME